jgi:hypothetical protein
MPSQFSQQSSLRCTYSVFCFGVAGGLGGTRGGSGTPGGVGRESSNGTEEALAVSEEVLAVLPAVPWVMEEVVLKVDAERVLARGTQVAPPTTAVLQMTLPMRCRQVAAP